MTDGRAWYRTMMWALVLPLAIASCSGGSQPETAADGDLAAATAEPQSDGQGAAVEPVAPDRGDGEPEDSGEHNGEGREGSGEHGGEGREGSGEHSGEGREGSGEHGGEGEGGEHAGEEGGHDEGGGEGEEGGTYVARGDTWDAVRRGARLVLSYDAGRDAFVGRVENTTNGRLCAVRVEVHVGGGPELGPTARTDIPAGGSADVVLPAEGNTIDTWTAHPEQSAC